MISSRESCSCTSPELQVPCASPQLIAGARLGEANAAALALLGAASASELCGRTLASIVAKGQHAGFACELARAMVGGVPRFATELGLPGGEPRRVRACLLACECEPARGPRRVLLLLEAGAPESVPRARPTRVCDELTRGLSHDLRSPLMAISGFAQVLGYRHKAELGADAQRCVENIVAAASRLERMLESLSEFGRLGDGGLALQALDLHLLLRGIEPSTRAPAAQLVLPEDLPHVSADPRVLRRSSRCSSNTSVCSRNTETGCGSSAATRTVARRSCICDGRSRQGSGAPWDGPGQRQPLEPHESLSLSFAARGTQLHAGRVWIETAPHFGSVFQLEFPGLNRA